MNLDFTPEASATLQRLRSEKKFTKEEFYPGAPTEEIRLRSEDRVNRLIEDVASLLRRGGSKDELFKQVAALHASFAEDDTEEREKVDDYVGEMMSALGIEDWTDYV